MNRNKETNERIIYISKKHIIVLSLLIIIGSIIGYYGITFIIDELTDDYTYSIIKEYRYDTVRFIFLEGDDFKKDDLTVFIDNNIYSITLYDSNGKLTDIISKNCYFDVFYDKDIDNIITIIKNNKNIYTGEI